jgi:hypothetical protein
MTLERACRSPRQTDACALALAFVLGGCSFEVIKPAPAPSTWPNPVLPDSSERPCTDSIGLPIVDTIIGGSLGTLTYIERNSGSHTITIGIGIASIPYLASAVYGYIQTARCDRYKSLFRPNP